MAIYFTVFEYVLDSGVCKIVSLLSATSYGLFQVHQDIKGCFLTEGTFQVIHKQVYVVVVMVVELPQQTFLALLECVALFLRSVRDLRSDPGGGLGGVCGGIHVSCISLAAAGSASSCGSHQNCTTT